MDEFISGKCLNAKAGMVLLRLPPDEPILHALRGAMAQTDERTVGSMAAAAAAAAAAWQKKTPSGLGIPSNRHLDSISQGIPLSANLTG